MADRIPEHPAPGGTIMKKTALITGSSRGIGAATAYALAEAGYAVCINYIEQRQKAEALVKALRDKGHTAICYRADVADASAVQAMAAHAGEELGQISLLATSISSPLKWCARSVKSGVSQTTFEVSRKAFGDLPVNRYRQEHEPSKDYVIRSPSMVF